MFSLLGLLQKTQIKQGDQFPHPQEALLLSLEGKVQMHMHKLRKLLQQLSCLWRTRGQRKEALPQTVPVVIRQGQGSEKLFTLRSFFSSEHTKRAAGSDKSWASPCLSQKERLFRKSRQPWSLAVVCFSWPSPSSQNCHLRHIFREYPYLNPSASVYRLVVHGVVYSLFEPADIASLQHFVAIAFSSTTHSINTLSACLSSGFCF